MAREWLLRGVDPEELKKEEVVVDETPKSKWDNFWYHHKWTFWGCFFDNTQSLYKKKRTAASAVLF